MANLLPEKFRLIYLLMFLLLLGCEQSSAPPANPAPPAAATITENISTDSDAPRNLKGELLDFTASWCGYCQQMAPLIAELKQQGYPIRTIDTDTNPELAEKFDVEGLPTFVYLVDKKEQTRISGVASKQELIELWR